MRRKYKGYTFLFTSADHGGRHIHVYSDNDLLGVYDKISGPIRGLERVWNNDLQEGLRQFIRDLNERGFFQ
jgi:hypothetical protein